MEASKPESSNTKKWLIGCGIGCGAVIIIVGILITAGYFFVKNIVDEFKDTEAMMSTLTERYGRIREFCPPPEGAIKSERLNAFLEARKACAPVREKMSQSLTALAEKKESSDIEIKTPKNIFKMIRLGFGIIPEIAEFIKSRNQSLLDAEIGLGEYYYLYAISYYSWLEKSVGDGPDFQIMGPDDGEGRFRYWDREDIGEDRRERMRRKINHMILPMMRCQLEKQKEKNAPGASAEWRRALAAEIKAMEVDQKRLPWQDGVPEVIAASLKPFRSRLEASYSPMVNPLELLLDQH